MSQAIVNQTPKPLKNKALEGIKPFYQKIYNKRQEAVGAEILMRPNLGNIVDIIRILEERNEIQDLDLRSFNYALCLSNELKISCSANFSGQSLSNKIVCETLMFCDPFATTKIEITEQKILSDAATNNIKYLAACGFKLSLDDYGSDRNGINRIVELPISEIKVDKFICDRLDTDKSKIAVESTLKLAERINCDVVVEGVEQRSQFETLVGLGVEKFQGFWLHKPEAL